MLNEACLAAWKLPADPFAYAQEPLAPLDRELDLGIYYDFYQWVDDAALGKLAPNGRISSWHIGQQGKMTVMLISGEQGCGRSSLKNLLLFELADRCKPAPIVAEYLAQPSTNRTSIAINVARAVERAVKITKPDLAKTIGETISTWRDDLIPGGEGDLDSLFTAIKQDIAQILHDTCVIVSINALLHQISIDAAHATAMMVQQLADFAILSVTDPNHGRIIRNKCVRAGQPVALVDAPKVDLVETRKFIAERFSRARAGAQVPSPIFPFTDQALTELFAPNRRGNKPVCLSLRVAIEKLSGAMSLRCDPAGCDPRPIDAADMRAVLDV